MKQVNKTNKTGMTRKSDIRIHRRITEQAFLKKIAKDPESVFTDFDVKYAVEILGNWCSSIDRRRKKNGVRILKNAGLTAFTNTSRGYLKEYRENPERLLSEVELRASELKEFLPKRAKSNSEKLEAIQKLIDPEDTGKSISSYFPSKSLRDCTNIALGWIAYDNECSFYTVSNLYEKLKKNRSQAVTPSYLYDYNEAYQNYVYKEQIQHDINDARKRLEQFEALSKQLKGVFKSIRD